MHLHSATLRYLQLQVITLLTFCNVQIEEVTVKNSLDHTSNNRYEVKKSLKIVAPNPVDQVQGTVQTQEEKVVSSDGLRFPSFADHKELGENGDRFKVDGESPQYLERKKQRRLFNCHTVNRSTGGIQTAFSFLSTKITLLGTGTVL